MSGRSFRDLEVWQLAMDLAQAVYEVTDGFPRHELYGLTGQLRRSAGSIPANIAEGARQRTPRGKIYFYTNALASEAELETHIELSRRRRYATNQALRKPEDMATRVAQMLYRLIDSQGH
jgi:four helix bundle protein